MKKSLLIIVLCTIVSGFSIYAQAQIEQCGTMKLLKEHIAADPGLKARLQQTEANAKAWASSNAKAASVVVRIPTVVHVIHNLTVPAQNIPDSVIYSQIEVLNEDFRRMNADAVNTRPIFDSIAADVEVEFCLASVDAAGNATTGINRVASTETGFEVFGAGMNDMKYTANGGADAWPRDQYLNIWVCNMTIFGTPGAILGFAQFPGDDPATDGVAIQFTFMGRTNDPVQSDSGLGRTVTHEVGHWLGLRHVWADDQDFFGNGTCDSSDFVDDTPNQEGASAYDCNMVINSCSVETPYWGTTDPPDMVENFMDYSSDSCSNMFSMGQKARMLSFLNTDRVSLLTSPGCGALSTVSTPTCAGSCTGQTSVTVNTGTPPFTYLWDDPALQTNSTATGLCAGTYTVSIVDAAATSTSVSVIVGSLSILGVSLSSTDASCDTCTDGSVTATTSGGLAPYTYTWTDSSGATVDPSLGLSIGSYNVLISDGCGQQIGYTFTIAVEVTPGQTSTSSAPACPATCLGQASVTVNTGTPPFTYLWSDPGAQTNSTAIGLCPGSYTIVVIDAAANIMNDTVAVAEVDLLMATLNSSDASCDSCSDGTVNAVTSGGISPYTYAWTDSSGSSIDPTITVGTGSYTVMISDGCGQQVIDSINVGVAVSVSSQVSSRGLRWYPNPSFGKLTVVPDPIYTRVSLQIFNGLGQLVREWNIDGEMNLDISDLEAGAYIVRAITEKSSTTRKLLLIQ